MTIYKDSDGWLYQVRGEDLGYRIFCKRNRDWVSFFLFPWRKTAEEAQADLDEHATEEGWEAVADA